jgi:hypothetical protein
MLVATPSASFVKSTTMTSSLHTWIVGDGSWKLMLKKLLGKPSAVIHFLLKHCVRFPVVQFWHELCMQRDSYHLKKLLLSYFFIQLTRPWYENISLWSKNGKFADRLACTHDYIPFHLSNCQCQWFDLFSQNLKMFSSTHQRGTDRKKMHTTNWLIEQMKVKIFSSSSSHLTRVTGW